MKTILGLCLLSSVALAQVPFGLPKLPAPIPYTTSTYGQHVMFQTDGGVGAAGIDCLAISRGTDWRCLAEDGYVDSAVLSATTGLASTSYVAAAVASATAGLASTAYVAGAIGTATTGLASAADVAAAVAAGTAGLASTGYVSTAITSGTSGLASTSYVDASVATGTAGLASTSYVTSAVATGVVGLASTAYVDAASATVSASIPVVPRILLSPASSAPSTSTVGASYYDTALGCIRSWTGSTWSPLTCPILTAPTRVAWSASLDFGSLSAGTCADLTFTATGAVANEAVACGGLAALALQDAGLYAMCGVSATNTGFVRSCCQRLLASCGNPTAVTFALTAVR